MYCNDISITSRVTAEQKRIMTEAADRVGLDLSSWLRQLGLKAADASISTEIKGNLQRA
jgi:uncharacterized protein (DUF1778 family)